MDEAKEEWISRVAREAESARRDGKHRWASIRKLQMAHAGRQPARPTRLCKGNEAMTRGPEEVKRTWYEHFSHVLNIPSHYQESVLDEMTSLPPALELDHPPTFEELITALSRLKRGKAGGRTGILPELVLYGGSDLLERLLVMMDDVWREEEVVKDWRDAEVIPIPKKGDLRRCDNWRGISLLDVVGKVFARIMQDRLQVIAEKMLPESQCGFRKGRGCVDMIFAARQLVEKNREHADSLFVLFVDLKKAYDSVPRQALWCVLKKCGVPPVMLSVIKSFHEGMSAVVRVGDSNTDAIEVTNGLRQGCTMAPTLFNLYFSAMVQCWRDRCPQAGVTVRFKMGRKLVGDRTAKSRLQEVRVTELQFADDVALYATTREKMEQVAGEFVKTAAEWGLTVSLEKTKLLTFGNDLRPEDNLPIQLEGGEISAVEEFTYLGSTITRDGEVYREVVARLEKASRAFGCLRAAVFQNKRISIATKREVYRAVVFSTLLYGAETWSVKAHSVRRMKGFHNRCIRSMLGVSKLQQWRQRLTSQLLAKDVGMTENMSVILRRNRFRWLGHMARMDGCRLPKQLLFGELVRPRPSHGTKRRWRDLAAGDVEAAGLGGRWYEVAQDRGEWKHICKCLTDISKDTQSAPNTNTGLSYPCSCGRIFHRQGDLTRHSRFCDGSQHSRTQSSSTFDCCCGRSFRRRGDLTRHSRYCKSQEP